MIHILDAILTLCFFAGGFLVFADNYENRDRSQDLYEFLSDLGYTIIFMRSRKDISFSRAVVIILTNILSFYVAASIGVWMTFYVAVMLTMFSVTMIAAPWLARRGVKYKPTQTVEGE